MHWVIKNAGIFCIPLWWSWIPPGMSGCGVNHRGNLLDPQHEMGSRRELNWDRDCWACTELEYPGLTWIGGSSPAFLPKYSCSSSSNLPQNTECGLKAPQKGGGGWCLFCFIKRAGKHQDQMETGISMQEKRNQLFISSPSRGFWPHHSPGWVLWPGIRVGLGRRRSGMSWGGQCHFPVEHPRLHIPAPSQGSWTSEPELFIES